MTSGVLDSVRLDLVDTIDKAGEFKQWLGDRRPDSALGVDTETGSLNPYGVKPLRLVQFGDAETGWAVPWHLWGGVAMEALNAYQGQMIFHNARFDVGWLTQKGGWSADWSRIHDTLTLAHLDDPTRSRGLKPLGGMLIDPRAATSQKVLDNEMTKNNWDWNSVPITRDGAGSSYWIYGALDPVLTCRLYDHFKQTRLTYARAYELEMGTVRCISDMERLGARVDLDYCRRKIEMIEEYSHQVRAWIREAHGIQNATSTMQCIQRFEDLGRTITRFTKAGAKSLDKEQLETFFIEESDAGNDLAKALLSLRKGEKQIGPYFKNFEKGVDTNDRVHPTIWPCGTRTARMSVTQPALQTLPRKDPAVRGAFIPSDGNLLITIDADQIEMRLAAHFSRDEGLRHAFVEEADFFNTVASQAWRDKVVKGDPRRQTTKNACYGKLYGASVAKIALTAGVPIHDMQIVMANFDSSFPGIHKMQEEVIRVGRARSATEGRPYVVTPTGRRLYGDKGKEYALTNYLIQSHAAEVLKQGICDLSAAGLGEYMILPVHDELVLDVPVDIHEDVKRTLESTLNAVGGEYFVPLTWSADIMERNWGQKYE